MSSKEYLQNISVSAGEKGVLMMTRTPKCNTTIRQMLRSLDIRLPECVREAKMPLDFYSSSRYDKCMHFHNRIGDVDMINFEEEIARFSPSLEISQAEEAILSREIVDVADIIERILQEKKEL